MKNDVLDLIAPFLLLPAQVRKDGPVAVNQGSRTTEPLCVVLTTGLLALSLKAGGDLI